jgi:hypothetical protein
MLTEVEDTSNFDEDEKEAIERHQLDSVKAQEEQAKYDEEHGDKQKKLDEFEAKLETLRLEHEKAAQEKDSAAVNKLKKLLEEKSSKPNKIVEAIKDQSDSSSSDEN